MRNYVGNKKTKLTFIISVLKVEHQVGLVFVSNLFIIKFYHANKSNAEKIPTCSNSALVNTYSFLSVYHKVTSSNMSCLEAHAGCL